MCMLITKSRCHGKTIVLRVSFDDGDLTIILTYGDLPDEKRKFYFNNSLDNVVRHLPSCVKQMIMNNMEMFLDCFNLPSAALSPDDQNRFIITIPFKIFARKYEIDFCLEEDLSDLIQEIETVNKFLNAYSKWSSNRDEENPMIVDSLNHLINRHGDLRILFNHVELESDDHFKEPDMIMRNAKIYMASDIPKNQKIDYMRSCVDAHNYINPYINSMTKECPVTVLLKKLFEEVRCVDMTKHRELMRIYESNIILQ